MKLRVIESFLYFNSYLAAFTAIQTEFSWGRKFINVFDSAQSLVWNEHEAGSKEIKACCLLHDPPKRRLTFNRLHGSIFQKTELFVTVWEREILNRRYFNRKLRWWLITVNDVFRGMNGSVSSDVTPYSPLKVNRRFGETYRRHLQCRQVSQTSSQHDACSKHSSASCLLHAGSSETWFEICRTTRRYNIEDRILYTYRCENLKSDVF
jgi:hypothetical protein